MTTLLRRQQRYGVDDETIAAHRRLVAHLRATGHDCGITPRTPEQRAADLARCRAAWHALADDTERALDLHQRGCHQPALPGLAPSHPA